MAGSIVGRAAMAATLCICAFGAAAPSAAQELDGVLLRGGGSSFAAPMFRSWIEAFAKVEPGLSVDYDSIGSGEGMSRFISRRLNTRPLGFAATAESLHPTDIDKDNLLQFISAQDLKSFGLIPELIGRLPVLSFLNPLDATALKKILTEPKNALAKQYKKLFEMEGIELEFKDGALDFIVEKAAEFKLGARGLRSICEAIINDAMFEMPSDKTSDKLVINRAYAEEKFSKSHYSKLKVA